MTRWKDDKLAYQREYHKVNRKKINAQQRARYNRAQNTARYRKRKFGISQEQYDEMLQRQGGVCAICGEEERRLHPKTQEQQMLSVDHCHETNQIRGLLCADCNFMLGNAKDNISTLAKAIQYLASWEVTE